MWSWLRGSRTTIANQISAAFGDVLRRHPSAPRVIDCLDVKRPWLIPTAADVLVTLPYRAWGTPEAVRRERPLPNLRWVQVFSAGIDRFPKWLLEGRLVGCGRGQASAQIAEYVLAVMLQREKRLSEIRARSEADWGRLSVGTLQGRTLGLLGFGSIGAEIANRARPFGMNILACRRGEWNGIPEGITPAATIADVLSASDHVVVALPLTDATCGALDRAMLRHAKSGLHLINVSRGAIVVQEDLLALLDDGTIGFATLDVTEPEPLPAGHPLWVHDHVLLTPHVSFRGGDPFARFTERTLENLTAYASGAPLKELARIDRGY